ncbi:MULTISPECIES: hypothetical protein [unclassified Campylobacter]|uniref:hypothetical protein n=1 Tax=unclassified Campylobacter TaxID=2593542 RepID=UPI0014727F5A|nr:MULTISPECIES: hypothetical protein [unclassified Campylobacter]
MKKYFTCLLLAFFMFGCATTSEPKISKNAETKEYSSMLYAMKVTSDDGWQTASMIDSDDRSYSLKRQKSATGILLKNSKISVHIKGSFALFQSEEGEMIVLEEPK